MSSSRVFRGCGALMAAAKTAVSKSATVAKAAAAAAATPASTAKAAPKKPKKTRAATTTSSGEPRGILKVIPVSPALHKFLGMPEASRAEAVKKVWEHIKTNQLQDPANKKLIHCDEKLKSIFEGKETVGFLEVATLLSRQFVKTAE